MRSKALVKWIYHHPRLYEVVDVLLSLGLSERVRRKVLAGIDVSTALEVGVGTGKCLRYLRSNLLVGLDKSYQMASYLKKRFPHIVVSCGDAENLPFADNCFDLSIFCYCLASLPNPSRALVEGLRVSRKVLVIDYDRPSIIPVFIWKKMVKVMGRLIFGSNWLDYDALSSLSRCRSSKLCFGLYRVMLLDGSSDG
ncbi:MAG: class I SAM-dependent methyltransferase [bacterium]